MTAANRMFMCSRQVANIFHKNHITAEVRRSTRLTAITKLSARRGLSPYCYLLNLASHAGPGVSPQRRFFSYDSSHLLYHTMACKLLEKSGVTELFNSIDTVLMDCDGVLWEGAATTALPGVPETVQKLRGMGKKVFFVSNNSTKTRTEYAEKCNKLGYPCTAEDIICSAYATAQYIKNTLKYTGKCYMIGSTGLQGEFDEAGLPYVGVGEDPWNGRTVRDLIDTVLDPEVKCVVVGFDTDFNYLKLHKAQAYLNDPQCHFIATNTDAALPVGGGKLLPGTGSIVHCVAFAAGREPTICGKPHRPLGSILIDTHHIDPSRALMVGDRLDTDILLAHNCGMKSLLVLSGISFLEDARKKQSSNSIEDQKSVPDFYLASLADLGPMIS